MSERMVLVDFHRCVGCGSCEMACSLVHEGVCSATLSRIHVMRRVGAGWNVPLTCAMCERPLCMAACPVGAVEKDPRSGVVTIADERCIGCRQCVQACPFGHADFNPQAGVAFKCDHCGGDPQCVAFCWTQALVFAPLDEALAARRREVAERLTGL